MKLMELFVCVSEIFVQEGRRMTEMKRSNEMIAYTQVRMCACRKERGETERETEMERKVMTRGE